VTRECQQESGFSGNSSGQIFNSKLDRFTRKEQSVHVICAATTRVENSTERSSSTQQEFVPPSAIAVGEREREKSISSCQLALCRT